jgi:hypothetical protein
VNALATVLTTVNAPYSKKLDEAALVACLHDLDAAKHACGPISSFLGDVTPDLQEAFAAAHGIPKEELAAFAKAFSDWSGEAYPLAA